jgi:hypothetical protein
MTGEEEDRRQPTAQGGFKHLRGRSKEDCENEREKDGSQSENEFTDLR